MNEAMPSVLCVDDDANLLSSLERTLFDRYEVATANSAANALDLLAADGPPDIVISDMRMPQMDGAQFLAIVRERWPDTIRILLTGQADTQSAIAAINNGAIFKFLCKPCAEEALLATLRQASERHNVQEAERRLLETTLSATVKTLADILSLASPWAFRRAALARSCVQHALARLKWPQAWMYEVAASLSQIGSIGVPEETLRRDASQRPLSGADARFMVEHPETAYRLLCEIPRLNTIAEIVRYQARPIPVGAPLEVLRGAQLLRAALVLGQHLQRGVPVKRALEALRQPPHEIAAPILDALADFRMDPSETRAAAIGELVPGFVLSENVTTTKGQLLLSKGHELTEAAIHTLRRLRTANLIHEPIYVQMRPQNA